MPETISTTKQRVTIKTRRGNITVGPNGRIAGLWRIVRLELRTNEQVRKLCGGITRHTLKRWRTTGTFPEPVLSLKIGGPNGKVELWSRTEVEEWNAKRLRDSSST